MHLVKYDDETQQEYEAFVAWYLSDPRLAPQDHDLAQRNDWATRAALLDRSETQLPIERQAPQAQQSEIALQRLLMLEATKFLSRSEKAPGIPTLTPTELLRLAQIVLGKGPSSDPTELSATEETEVDLSGVSQEDLDAVERVARMKYPR